MHYQISTKMYVLLNLFLLYSEYVHSVHSVEKAHTSTHNIRFRCGLGLDVQSQSLNKLKSKTKVQRIIEKDIITRTVL